MSEFIEKIGELNPEALSVDGLDDAIIGFENFEPGVAQGTAFSASSMARTEANVLENAVMGAISDAIGLDEAVVTLPGSILN